MYCSYRYLENLYCCDSVTSQAKEKVNMSFLKVKQGLQKPAVLRRDGLQFITIK